MFLEEEEGKGISEINQTTNQYILKIITYNLNKNNENSTNHNFKAMISNDVKLHYSIGINLLWA